MRKAETLTHAQAVGPHGALVDPAEPHSVEQVVDAPGPAMTPPARERVVHAQVGAS